jgi:2-keto-4-pentenoate hydratase/2-oxohepta-3-ene-1,7-dioic acid hydratase in catechol pathway
MSDLPIDTPSKVICVGLNYRDHAAETGQEVPAAPVIFAKWPSCLVPAGAHIVLPDGAGNVDYEAELAVVIGERVRDVPVCDALSVVRGYLCFNDISAREVQNRDGQWTRGKSFDTFGPLGPRLVPADEVPDPQQLGIRCRVNGTVVQESNTRNMIFTVKHIIAAVSECTTLDAGDLIATGTPGGVGMAHKPPIWLRPGDIVEVEIERLGVLRNQVAAQAAEGSGN